MNETTKEVTASIPTELFFKINLFYDWSVTRKKPKNDKSFNEFVGEMVEVGFEKRSKEIPGHFVWMDSEKQEKRVQDMKYDE